MTNSANDRDEFRVEGRQVSTWAMIGGLAVGIALGVASCSWFKSGRSVAMAPEPVPTVSGAVVQLLPTALETLRRN